MSQQTNKKKRKVKRKVSVSTSTKVRKKSEQPKDTLKKVQGRPPSDVAPTFRIKIRKKR